MATLTLRNIPNQPLGTGYRDLDNVREKFRRKVKKIEATYGIHSSVCVLEETFKQKGRWHPHYHWAWFVPPSMTSVEQKKFEAEVLKAWLESAALAAMTPISVKAQSFVTYHGEQNIKNMAYYMTKHAMYPENTPHHKTLGGSRGLAPFEILELARSTGDMLWIQAYNEFEYTNKGRHRVTFFGKGGAINRKPAPSQLEPKHG
jgi:hypothetical protein